MTQAPGYGFRLSDAEHGKNRVRVAKVIRTPGQPERFHEYVVRIELGGGTEPSFLTGDNRSVVATDTCKNHVYMLAKQHNFSSPEKFAIDLANVFWSQYSFLRSVSVYVEEKPWERHKPHTGEYMQEFVCMPWHSFNLGA